MDQEEHKIQMQLRIAVKKELSNCSPAATPKFCAMIRTKEGYLKAEGMIIEYAIKNQVSISAAIGQLEAELL